MIKCKKCGERLLIKYSVKRKRSGYCRNCYIYVFQKERRLERRKNKCCITCGEKVEPKVVYPCRCKKCYEKSFPQIKKE